MKQNRPIILMWSSRYDFENGQAIVTRRVAECQSRIDWLKVVYDPGSGPAMLRTFFSIIRALCLVALRRPAAVYVVCSRSSAGFLRDAPVIALAYFRIRVIVHVHGSDLADLLTRAVIGGMARALYKRCEIIVPSSHMVPALVGLGCHSVSVCENFIAETEYSLVTPSSRDGEIRLLWNSNLMASKGIKESVEGARMARARGVKLRLTVLGQPLPDDEADLNEMIHLQADIAQEEWIDVLGPISSQDARRLVRSHDAVLLPSRYGSECQPLAVIEAMAAARAVIIRDTPALRNTVGSYPAFIVSGDARSICTAIELFGRDDLLHSKRLQEGALEARLRFSSIRFDAEMQAILENNKGHQNDV